MHATPRATWKIILHVLVTTMLGAIVYKWVPMSCPWATLLLQLAVLAVSEDLLELITRNEGGVSLSIFAVLKYLCFDLDPFDDVVQD